MEDSPAADGRRANHRELDPTQLHAFAGTSYYVAVPNAHARRSNCRDCLLQGLQVNLRIAMQRSEHFQAEALVLTRNNSTRLVDGPTSKCLGLFTSPIQIVDLPLCLFNLQ